MGLKDKIEELRRVIANTTGEKVTIVAAVKTQTMETIRELWQIAPDIVMGQNRADELTQNYFAGPRWQFIGQLQSNKVKYIIDKVELIQSLDRESLLLELERQAEKRGIVIPCLIEVNIADEPTKGGIVPSSLFEFVELALNCSHVKVEGLMTVAPQYESGEKLKSRFKEMRELFLKLKERLPDARYLSMGMSNDYIPALECGSNMIRVGRCLFGERKYV
ncbi:MAG: YggS family pyridoxal phosphate-dependent enzyme [Clostridiales bacterium]|nr:YggS family pyridoxal phosphate-dependent enzyme [Clostridiales bacterium]